MDVFEAIAKRRSIRAFKPEPIASATLDKLVEAARLAPTGANRQPLEFVVVDEPGLVGKVFETLSWAGYVAPRGDPPPGRRPTAYIVVLFNTGIGGNSADAAAAIENILLAGVAEGLGSCWVGSVNRPALRDLLDIPAPYRIDSVVALGRPDQESRATPYAGAVEYWMDEAGNFHVPKRPLEAICHRNGFQDKGKGA